MKVLISLLLISALVFGSCIFEEADVDYRVGINTTEPIEISRSELLFLYKGTIKVIKGNKHVTIFVKPYYNYFQKEMVTYILGMNFSEFIESVNRNDNIKVVRNDILAAMANTPYSIGILSDTEVYVRGQYDISLLKVIE